MPRKLKTAPRKQPSQDRSRALVDAVLEAAARVLVDRGYEGTTTNRIAVRAGVSVGSIYQYFPNKQSIVRALLERHVDQAMALRPAALDGDELALRERMLLSVRWFLDVHSTEPELHRILTSLAPEVIGTTVLREFEAGIRARIREVLEEYAAEVRPGDLDVASFIVATCLESLTHGAVVHHPEILRSPRLAEEMGELLVRYLEPAPA